MSKLWMDQEFPNEFREWQGQRRGAEAQVNPSTMPNAFGLQIADHRCNGLKLCLDPDIQRVEDIEPEIGVIGANVVSQLRLFLDPFCCGDPGCHLGLVADTLEEVGDHIRRAMGLQQTVSLDFGQRIGVCYHSGVAFHHGVTGR
jgi:hypothetical protein